MKFYCLDMLIFFFKTILKRKKEKEKQVIFQDFIYKLANSFYCYKSGPLAFSSNNPLTNNFYSYVTNMWSHDTLS